MAGKPSTDTLIVYTLVLLALLTGPQAKTECQPQFAPLDTGTTSGDSNIPFWREKEAAPWRGDGWIGWNAFGDKLEPLRLIIKDRPKQENDDDAYLTVERDRDVTYAVRCMPELRPGRIHNVGIANHSLGYDGPLKISLGKSQYTLRLQATDESLVDARVILTDGRQTQVLYSTDGFVDDPLFYIEWAGDLDHDGRLDLVVNLSRKYSIHPHRLLLSSRAKRGQLVGEAGVFVSSD